MITNEIQESPNTQKTAELVADNKLTILHLYNLANEEETEVVMPHGFNRVQEVLDWLNDPEIGNDYVCLGWHYEYRPHEEEF
jgi:hypothetical protein